MRSLASLATPSSSLRALSTIALVTQAGCKAPMPETCSSDLAGVQQIFDASCAISGCHTANDSAGRLSLASGTEPMAHLVGAPSSVCRGKILVVPGAPERSYLCEKIQGGGPECGAHMPPGARLSPVLVSCVRAWISSMVIPSDAR